MLVDELKGNLRMDDKQQQGLEAYSCGEMTAIELRRRLNGASYGDVLRLLSEAGLPLPRAPVAGREEQIARAHAWMFPKHAA
jgi:hypothetical protein